MSNTNRTQDQVFPLTYSGWDECDGDYGDIILHDPIFTDDFGPIKKSDSFDSVAIFHSKGILECYSISKDKILKVAHTIKFKAIPTQICV